MGILLYGSASRTADPSQFSDYDNWVVVKNVPRAHRILKGTMPSVYLDKIVEGDKSHNLPNTKHVGIHLFPESSEYLERHIEISSKLSRNRNMKILVTDKTQNMDYLVKKWFGKSKVSLL